MATQNPLHGKKILIVEDYFINQEMMVDMLESMGCEVDAAEDGEQALSKWKENGYDLILMDIQMPRKDGYEVTREIRSLENNEKHTIIVALTANALDGDKEKCLEAGMDDYLSKPIDKQHLSSKMIELLNEKRSH